MKQKLFKTKVVEDLENNIKENLEKYSSLHKSPNAFIEMFEQTNSSFARESKIEIENIELLCGGPDTDIENAKIIHNALKNLTSTQAVSKELWVYMTHIQFPQYMASRWNVGKDNTEKNKPEDYIKSRYFFARGIKGTVRNGIARLWWAGKWGYDETRENPYELVEILLDKQETFLHVSERSFNLNRNIFAAALIAIRDNKLTSTEIKILYKKINARGGLIPLDALDKSDAETMVEEIVKSIVSTRKLKDKILAAIG